MPEMEAEAEEGETEDNAQGTGIGEGEGTRDVSKEIEDEEQVLGTQDQNEQTGENQAYKQDDGIEMENDFEDEWGLFLRD